MSLVKFIGVLDFESLNFQLRIPLDECYCRKHEIVQYILNTYRFTGNNAFVPMIGLPFQIFCMSTLVVHTAQDTRIRSNISIVIVVQ